MSGAARFRTAPAAVIEIAGRDREAFLQGQCTNDVLRLEPGGVARAAALSPKGKLLADFRVARIDPLRILAAPGRGEALAAHFRKYAVFQDVRIEQAGASHLFEIFGAGGPLPEPAPGRVAVSQFAGRPVEIWPPFFETSASWLVAAADAPEIEAALSSAGERISDGEAEALRVEAGRPEYGRDMDDSNLPDEIGMDDAISTTKGCYVGQEIVARQRTYGRVTRRLVGLSFAEDWLAPAGCRLVRPREPGREAGRVTSAVWSPRFGAIGLGFVVLGVEDGDVLRAADDESKTARVGPKKRS